MKKIGIILLMCCTVGTYNTADAQSILKKAANAAKKATERNVEKKTEKAVDKVFDKAEEVVTGQGNNNENQTQQVNSQQTGQTTETDAAAQDGTAQQGQSVQMNWNKFDFVSGDEIIFEDNLASEQLGEFPSQWDLLKGNVEVVKMDGDNAICLAKTSEITPLMKNPKEYLPESFTVEIDFYIYPSRDAKESLGTYQFIFQNKANKNMISIWFYGHPNGNTLKATTTVMSNGQERKIEDQAPIIKGDWNRLSVSFNKRALKVYLNETRVANAPNVDQANWFYAKGDYTYAGGSTLFYIKNIRIAKGAVPLYDRMLTDGKFITYGITFDVGKSNIKPESMGEINRIVTLMKENADLKFSVEGHTDSTGNTASNQTLSEARSKAIVDKLVEMGIAADRLSSAGKGQESPIADNATDEGRAKNRRVEFVKI